MTASFSGVLVISLAGINGRVSLNGFVRTGACSGQARKSGQAEQARVLPRLDALNLASMVLLLALLLAGSERGSGLAAVVAALLMLARLVNWKGWLVAGNPLLWILHVSLLWVLSPGMVMSFLAIQLAALVRVLTAWGVLDWTLGVRLSGALWVLSFLLFLVFYTGVLMKPRVDGREGSWRRQKRKPGS